MIEGAAAILYREDKVLIVRNVGKSRHVIGTYGLPGGEHEECDKDTRHTAVREIEEESGLIVDREDLGLLGHYDFEMARRNGKQHMSLDLYATKRFRGSIRNGTETEPMWVKIDDYVSGMYPLPYMTGNFSDDIKNFLRKVKM